MERLAKFIGYLRSRPEHERRIMGVALWFAFAAVFTSIWITSFRKTITFESQSYQLTQKTPKTEYISEGAGVAVAPELPSPLKSLLGGFKELMAKVGNINVLIQNQIEKSSPPQLENQSQTAIDVTSEEPIGHGGSKVEIVAWIPKTIDGLTNVFNSLFEVLEEIAIKVWRGQ